MKQNTNNLLISLTSYPKRITYVHKTLKSLFNQTVLADKIVLNLSIEEFPERNKDLPNSLKNYIKKGLEINWCNDIKSYKKLIPTLKKYPNSIIVTADDDIVYNPDWLELLYKAYQKNKNYIYAHRAHLILFDNSNQIKKYDDWLKGFNHKLSSYKLFGTSGAGMLFPPHCFKNEIFNQDVFMRLCPTADDIWFNSMAIYSRIKIKNLGTKGYLDIENVPKTQLKTLTEINVNQKMNNVQLENIFKFYPIIKKRVYSKFDIRYNLYLCISYILKILKSNFKK